ncbi:MAG: SDR family oxidoreductase [Thaumarchaeota archaeon]|nr:SDR family oxidoreductase [Nitrososphaerota archaeon]
MSADMKRKVCIVTGTSSGIGYATAIGLAKLNATVVAVMRDSPKSAAALNEIKSKSGMDDSIIWMKADLSSQESIRAFVNEYNQRFNRLDVLINNAGVNNFKKTVTPEGIETTFAVNVLAPFLLSNLLLDKLRSSSPSRIVNVSSEAANGVKIDFENLQGEKKYSMFGQYGQTKLALNLITVELSRRLSGTGVTANFLHPGVIRSNLARGMNPLANLLLSFVKLFFGSPEKGARTSIHLATSPDVEAVSGKYFSGQREARANPLSYDESLASRMWKICEDLTKEKLPPAVAAPTG